jgi:hypothetical protein
MEDGFQGKNLWETEGERINSKLIDKILFQDNVSVSDFINLKDRNFIIATKGIGKSLLLKAKKQKLLDEYSIVTNDDKKLTKVLFIPNDKPFIDFIWDFGSLSSNDIKYLEDSENCVKIWSIALQISIVQAYYNKGDYDKAVTAYYRSYQT